MPRLPTSLVLSFVFACACAAPLRAQGGMTATPTYRNYMPPQYTEAVVSSAYVLTRDGVRLAVDVALPKGLPAGVRVPAVLEQTRYWRAREGQREAGATQRFFTSHGYAYVTADVRGTGASTGVWRAPWSREEIRDGGELVEWIVRQPWSNGRVGALGNSYSGTSAQLLAVPNHPAVKAVIPRHYEFDVYADNVFPGGVFNEWLVKTWDEGNRQLDLSPGVKPVESDADGSVLRQALKEHAANIDLYKAARLVSYRDERPFAALSTEDFSVYAFAAEIGRSGVAINSWGGWFDAGTADAVIKSFLTLPNPQRAVIGPWNHGGGQNASPYLSPSSPQAAQRMEWLRFFDQHLKGLDTGLTSERSLTYYTLGEERWKTTKTWPPAGAANVRWYFAEGHALSRDAPKGAEGSDSYTVNFEATTGEHNRWRTQLGGKVEYPDRAEEETRLLTYTSPPLAEDTEVTGHPVVNLQVSATTADAALFVYLEEVDERGRVTYITEGQLRASNRELSKDAPYRWPAPFHPFRKKDAAPLVPGRAAEIRFALLPTSVLLRKGHRIRIAVAGHDKSVFARTPSEGTPVLTFERNKGRASFVELPVIPPSRRDAAAADILTIAPAPAAPAPAVPAGLPTVEQILERYVAAVGGRAAIERLTSRVLKGTYTVPGRNFSAPVTIYAKAPDKLAIVVADPEHTMMQGFDGKVGWEEEFGNPGLRELSGVPLAELRRQADFYHALHLRESYPKMTLMGTAKVGDREAYVIEAVPAEGRTARLYFDAQTHLLVRRDLLADPPQEQPIAEALLEDFREVDGVRIPFTRRTFYPLAGEERRVVVITLDDLKHNIPIDDSRFKKP
ncbi:MAG: CocE/NonD family hydrolase [Pyrinomonadaceae bacterium]